MADRLQQLVLDGLNHAIAEPLGRPLLPARGRPGLFARSAAGKQAAQHCEDAGYLRRATDSEDDVWAITDEGLAFVLSQTSPRHAVDQLCKSIDARGRQLTELVAKVAECQDALQATETQVAALAGHVNNGHANPAVNGAAAWQLQVLEFVRAWPSEHGEADCPLPVMYNHARKVNPRVTIGQFHDALRRWHEGGRIYLHPWTGPLHDLPTPGCCLLVGHVVAYYASPRMEAGDAPQRKSEVVR